MNSATRVAYGQALVELAEKNPDVVVLDADLGAATNTNKFGAAFPERYFDMGISEADMMATAAGFATAGKIPFASTFAVFAAGRAFDQVRNSIAYPKLNVKIGATHAGISVGADGGSHQAIEDMALMRALPNMTVICPSDDVEARAATFAAAEMEGPVYLRFSRYATNTFHGDDYTFMIGKGEIVREGTDVALIACGLMVNIALEAAEQLAGYGVSARVVNMPTIKPLDNDLVLDCARTIGKIVTCEEHSVIGGLGSAVCELTSRMCPVPVSRLGVNDVFGKSGDVPGLFEEYGLTAAHIVKKVNSLLA
ncbi:MAG: transketolase family protein [Atopobiaceae bacterium]|nr:transketolase family protein [Atopobiaceae bacterium]